MRTTSRLVKKKRCINAIDTFAVNRTKETVKRVLNSAREYYGNNNLKRKNVRPTKLIGFEGIAKHHYASSMLYEPKKDSGMDPGSIWRLVYGKIQYKSGLPMVNIGLLGGHCFYIKNMDVLCNRWECKGCKQIFTHDKNERHLKEGTCTGGKTKMICSGGKFRHILNSSEVFYGGDTKFSYTACQKFEAEIGGHVEKISIGKKISIFITKCVDMAGNAW